MTFSGFVGRGLEDTEVAHIGRKQVR